jgi:hypothetical protein
MLIEVSSAITKSTPLLLIGLVRVPILGPLAAIQRNTIAMKKIFLFQIINLKLIFFEIISLILDDFKGNMKKDFLVLNSEYTKISIDRNSKKTTHL